MAMRRDLEGRLREARGEYRRLDRRGKGRMLGHWGKVTGYSRRRLMRKLGDALPKPAAGVRSRRAKYSAEAIRVGKALWEWMGGPGEVRFMAQLGEWAPDASKHVTGWSKEIGRELSQMSARQFRRRLSALRTKERRRGNCTTRPGTLRMQIPVSTMRPCNAATGLIEIDTVSHGGDRARGTFVWTVNTTDVATGWTAAEPVLGNAAAHVVPALEALIGRLPFPPYELHSDNGSEFINHHLVRWCEERGILLTRGRPNRKNDNPYISRRTGPIRAGASATAATTARRTWCACAPSTPPWSRSPTCSRRRPA